jgi:hypothetical protein
MDFLNWLRRNRLVLAIDGLRRRIDAIDIGLSNVIEKLAAQQSIEDALADSVDKLAAAINPPTPAVEDHWADKDAQDVSCPECSAPEYMFVRPMLRGRTVGGELVEKVSGACVVCLVCETPYVIAPHRAGGVLKRRRVAAGVPVPPVRPESRKPDANGALDLLARDLGAAGLREEP